jgi:Tfp pilus assembly protein PilX
MSEQIMKFDQEKGAILLDCLMALVIFALAGMMIMQVYGMLVRNSSDLRQENDATYLAMQEVESMRQLDQKGVLRSDTTTWQSYITKHAVTKTLNGFSYNISIALIETSKLPSSYTTITGQFNGTAISSNTNITPVRITVNWSQKGLPHSVIFETYLVK